MENAVFHQHPLAYGYPYPMESEADLLAMEVNEAVLHGFVRLTKMEVKHDFD